MKTSNPAFFVEIKFMHLKGLFDPACLARAVSWFAFVVAIFTRGGGYLTREVTGICGKYLHTLYPVA